MRSSQTVLLFRAHRKQAADFADVAISRNPNFPTSGSQNSTSGATKHICRLETVRSGVVSHAIFSFGAAVLAISLVDGLTMTVGSGLMETSEEVSWLGVAR